MNHKKEQQMQENLSYLREQFDELNPHIKLPHSLDADMLRYRLEQVDSERENPLSNRRRIMRFVTAAAAFVFVFGAFYLFDQSQKAAPALEKTADSLVQEESIEARGRSALYSPEEMALYEGEALPEVAAVAEEQAEPVAEAAPMPMTAGAPAQISDAPMSVALRQGEDISSSMQTQLSLHDIRAQEWGGYLPEQIPSELTYNSGGVTQGELLYTVFLNESATEQLRIGITPYRVQMEQFVLESSQAYRAEAAQLSESTIFHEEDVSEALIATRIFADDAEAADTLYGQFGVLYKQAGIVVEYFAVGLTSQELYRMVQSVPLHS